ncbi:protein of unknown function [Streptantibioticus cattleyicolor NRRL 8057 = DSM 46488]|nr:protein of unknown function [Streptantibioticus cattleyicolor NRRL 8057 = DSM 46488]
MGDLVDAALMSFGLLPPFITTLSVGRGLVQPMVVMGLLTAGVLART